MLRTLAILLVPLLVTIYTFSFGRYNWRQGNKVGAVGVFALALGTLGIPMLVLILK